ncbi:MAG: HAMP domain-containing histidine kinase [Cellulosilyticum sp.]|nr:HAMP domain-containing histidine kinase [Cellulosilyticum sp.]
MEHILVWIIILLVLILIKMYWSKTGTDKKLKEIAYILKDIEAGNRHHKIFIQDNSDMAEIIFQMNHIVADYIEQIEQLEKREKQYKELLTSLSHDIRSPLASLMGYIEAIDEGYIGEERKDDYLKIVRSKSYDLKQLIDRLFEWFKLESKEMVFTLESLDINETTRRIIGDFIPIFEKQSIHYVIEIEEKELYIALDAEAYRRILDNLIQNIILHSKADVIQIGTKVQDQHVLIWVKDNGIGIASEYLPYIFDHLYKCDKSRTSKGSGLGLYITKALVENQQGRIEVFSKQGEGTKFQVSFPIRK